VANPYDTLGVPKNASQEEIKKAYRKLVREVHPDRNPGDASAEERFKDVQAAYDLLSDPEKRRQYDTFGERGARGATPGGGFAGDFDLGDLGDLFGGLFGRGRGGAGAARGPVPERGADLETEVRLSFEDALEGATVRVPVDVQAACHTCGGSGARPGTAPKICPQCNGRGVVSESQGFFALSQPCPRCRGNGTVIEEPCPTCHGSGLERTTKRYQVKVKPGVSNGTRIRLAGKGEPGRNGGPAGDLYVVTRVDSSPLYERRGADLVIEVPVTYPEAALGATVEVPTPDGKVSLKVPAGSQDGKLLRLKGRGAPKLNGGGKGDLLARVRVTVPKKLTKAEREALEELQKVSRENPREAFAG
jgi:molecular chaperone DnaJ